MAITIAQLLGREPDRHIREGEPTWTCQGCGFDFHHEEPSGRMCTRCDTVQHDAMTRECREAWSYDG